MVLFLLSDLNFEKLFRVSNRKIRAEVSCSYWWYEISISNTPAQTLARIEEKTFAIYLNFVTFWKPT